jgi:hypothetical protein
MSNELYQDKVGKDIYWNGKGKHQNLYEIKNAELVPYEGKCDTVEGEMLRATAKLYYDYYNNGMCNNTSGPAKFLMIQDDELKLGVKDQIEKIYYNSNNAGYGSVNLEVELEQLCDVVIEYLGEHSGTVNTKDMYDYQDEDLREDEDEWDNRWDDSWHEDEE